jgi:diguanylate cyclase (GGDEF)-like protein
LNNQEPAIVHESVIEEVLIEASRLVEVRIAQFRALLAGLLMIFTLQLQLQTAGGTPRTALSLGLIASLLALGFSLFVIYSHRKKKRISVNLLAICSIGLDTTLMVLPVSLYFTTPQTPTLLPVQSGALLNQPTVFAMYLLVIASGLRFRRIATLGILVNSFVILSLMLTEALVSMNAARSDALSMMAIKQHILLLICSALLAWLISSHTRMTTQKAAQAALRATTDALTGTYNRHYLRQRLEELYESRERQIHLLMIDADHFKAVNDTAGHLVGDRVLVELSRRIQISIRPTDLLARYGGEEFCVVLPDIDDVVAVTIAERVRRAVEDQSMEDRQITVSIGLSRRTTDESIAALLDRADRALYRSKEGGRNQVQAEWPEGNLEPAPDSESLLAP